MIIRICERSRNYPIFHNDNVVELTRERDGKSELKKTHKIVSFELPDPNVFHQKSIELPEGAHEVKPGLRRSKGRKLDEKRRLCSSNAGEIVRSSTLEDTARSLVTRGDYEDRQSMNVCRTTESGVLPANSATDPLSRNTCRQRSRVKLLRKFPARRIYLARQQFYLAAAFKRPRIRH